MNNFVIFFEGTEGTSPLVRLLDNFRTISIVHQTKRRGWEPFDRHNCGPMSLKSLGKCLDLIFGPKPIDLDQLNRIYCRTAKRPLHPIDKHLSIGFKMRFVAPSPVVPRSRSFSRWNHLVTALTDWQFRKIVFDVLKQHSVIVFLAVRQDLLRWALSKYHGDGTGKRGHLQFKIARGTRVDTSPFHVDCLRLQEIISQCAEAHERKRTLFNDLQSEGIAVHSLLYEDFLDNKKRYLENILDALYLKADTAEIESALAKGVKFRKVHPNEISKFVLNHEEVAEKLGSPFVRWK